MKVNRRRFLGFAAGAATGTALGVPASRVLSDLIYSVEQPIDPPGGPERLALSVCALCPGGCGLRVRRVGDRAVKVDGNPLHPVNRGRLCPRGQAALQSLYHPDRVRGPMRRVGPRGEIGSFEPASWEEALAHLADRLRLLRREGRPEALVLARGRSRGIASRLAERFVDAFGSPNVLSIDWGEEAGSQALHLLQGVRATPAYDLQSAEYVLSFGGALLEASSSPVHTMQAFGEFRQGRPGRRGKLVQVEPRQSVTAAGADEWIPLRQGTEGILALGVAAILVAEGLFDRAFVSEMCEGFERFVGRDGKAGEGLRTLLERRYSLERVSADTGVSGAVLLRIAREFAAARPGLAIGPRRGPLLPGDLFSHLAAQTLSALGGNVDMPGGLLVPEEVRLPAWPDLPQDPTAEAGRARPRLDGTGGDGSPRMSADPEQLADALLEGSPYAAEVLVLLRADPAYSSTDPERFAAALERVPLVVSFASLPDDTALLADWILPESHFLESWELDSSPPGVPFPVMSLASPVLEAPLHEVRPAAELFLDLSRRVDGPVAEALPWRSVPALIRSEVEGLYEARRGAVMGTPFDEAWVRMMERAGWWAPGYRSAQELWERMEGAGGWWDPFYDHGSWDRVLQTASGRYEFRPDLLREQADLRAGTPYRVSGGAEESAGADGSLTLFLFEPLPIAGGAGAELPFLNEILEPGLEEAWETWVEIHPTSARALGVHDHDRVRVESPQASLMARARVTSRVVPGIAAIPLGLGKSGGGRWASGMGGNPMRLLSPDRDPLSGLPNVDSTRVRVTAVGGERRARRTHGGGEH